MNRLGIYYTDKIGNGVKENLTLFKSLGFECFFTDGLDDAKIMDSYAEAAGEIGMFYECIHAPFKGINSMWQPGEEGDRMLERLKYSVLTCARLGIPYAVVHLSSGDNAPCINDLGHARYDDLVECAVKNGVTVAFENQRKLANLAFVMELYRDVPQVGFCWDVGHEKCFADGKEFMPLFGDRLVYTHIHDNLAEKNGDLHLIPFDGSIDYEVTASHLKKAGFTGTLTLEVFTSNSRGRYDGMSAEAFYTKAANAGKKIRELVEKA